MQELKYSKNLLNNYRMFFTKGTQARVILTVHNNKQQYQPLIYEKSHTESSVNISNDDTDKLLSLSLETILRLKK